MSGSLSDALQAFALLCLFAGFLGALFVLVALAVGWIKGRCQRLPGRASFTTYPLPPSGTICSSCLHLIPDGDTVRVTKDGSVLHPRCFDREERERRATIRDDGIIGWRA